MGSENGCRHELRMAYRYRWSKDVEHLLPRCYKKRCIEFNDRKPIPVHWRPKPEYGKHPVTGEKIRIFQNYPVKVIYPEECNKGLWGGEGLIEAFAKKKKTSKRTPTLWRPYLEKRVFYSEILDRWFLITVTPRVLNLVDEAFGFDYYILKTHEVDLNSKLGIDLKRELLLALARKSFYPDDPEKQKRIYERYKEFVIPEEVAEWVGLSVVEALHKAQELEAKNKPRPLKELLTEDLLNNLKIEQSTDPKVQSTWLSKLNPFKSVKD